MIKKLLALWLMLMLPFSAARAQITLKEAEAAARECFPDWQIWETTEYWSSAHHGKINLLKLEGNRLYFRELSLQLNALSPSQPIPWEIEDWAPLPLNEEAAARAAQLEPEDMMGRYNTEVAQALLPGSAEFLLQEGKR